MPGVATVKSPVKATDRIIAGRWGRVKRKDGDIKKARHSHGRPLCIDIWLEQHDKLPFIFFKPCSEFNPKLGFIASGIGNLNPYDVARSQFEFLSRD